MKLIPKNWVNFQHYKHRSPPWIKLHKNLLDDMAFQRLPLASKALAPMLWLLASESSDGVINKTPEEIAFRLRMTEKEVVTAINPLIDSGFFINASDMLADCLQDATTEKSRVEKESGTEKQKFKKTLKTSIPENFCISERVKNWAIKNKAFGLERHFDNFVLQAQKQGYKYADWDAALMTAIRDNWAKVEKKVWE